MTLDPASGDTIRLVKAAEVVAANLRRRIVRGELAPGAVLPNENDLTAEFGISRPTLREAFRVLEAEGLITVRRGSRGGARVRRPSIATAASHVGHVLQYRGATVQDVYTARDVIEAPAARIVAERCAADDLARLAAAVAAEEGLRSGDVMKLVAQQHEFHLLITELAGNTTLHLLDQALHHMVESIGRSRVIAARDSATDFRHTDAASDVHARVVELIRRGDEDGADRLWRRHLAQTSRFVLAASTPDAAVEFLL